MYQHHGIDCGDQSVIHYSKAGDEAAILRTSIATAYRSTLQAQQQAQADADTWRRVARTGPGAASRRPGQGRPTAEGDGPTPNRFPKSASICSLPD